MVNLQSPFSLSCVDQTGEPIPSPGPGFTPGQSESGVSLPSVVDVPLVYGTRTTGRYLCQFLFHGLTDRYPDFSPGSGRPRVTRPGWKWCPLGTFPCPRDTLSRSGGAVTPWGRSLLSPDGGTCCSVGSVAHISRRWDVKVKGPRGGVYSGNGGWVVVRLSSRPPTVESQSFVTSVCSTVGSCRLFVFLSLGLCGVPLSATRATRGFSVAGQPVYLPG